MVSDPSILHLLQRRSAHAPFGRSAAVAAYSKSAAAWEAAYLASAWSRFVWRGLRPRGDGPLGSGRNLLRTARTTETGVASPPACHALI